MFARIVAGEGEGDRGHSIGMPWFHADYIRMKIQPVRSVSSSGMELDNRLRALGSIDVFKTEPDASVRSMLRRSLDGHSQLSAAPGYSPIAMLHSEE